MTKLSLASVLAEAARRRPSHIALIEGDQRIDYQNLWQQVQKQAGALREQGVRPGDHVALMCPNTAEFPTAYYAILTTGAIVVPVHLLLTDEEVTRLLHDSGATLLLCHAATAEVGTRAASAAGIPLAALGPPVDVPGSVGRLDDLPGEAMRSYEPRDPSDTAVIFYTSGTTGRPKGAMLSHLNLVMNATVNAFDTFDATRDDIILAALPLFHTFGQTVSMNTTIRLGATMVLLPRFDGAAAVDLMVAEQVSIFHGVPTMYMALLTAAKNAAALPRLRFALSGGAPLPETALHRFREVFDAAIFEGYGLSETSPVATVNQPDFGNRDNTVGHPLWGVEAQVADPGTSEIQLLPDGAQGEVVVRGHNVFTGYLNDSEATDAVLRDGWFRTGDLGVKDTDGFLKIVDRLKDMIIRGGNNVYPTEVENVLLTHPGIAQAAVIGLPHDSLGEEICAVLVAEGDPPDADDISAHARQHLAAHKYPRHIEFVDELPLGPSMKVLKRVLRERFS